MPDVRTLRDQLIAAEEEANRVLLADDFALTNGAYAAAMRVVYACRAELLAAEASLAGQAMACTGGDE